MRAVSLFLAFTCLGAHAQTSIFQVVATPNENQPFPANNYLQAVSASSPNDIWAVGASVIHYDGQGWTAFPAPEMPGDGTSWFTGVADLSPTDAWAIGVVGVDTASVGQVIEQWNGSVWTVYPGPNFPAGSEPEIWSMTTVSPTDIWAAGSVLTSDQALLALFEHWNGTSWTATPEHFYGFPNSISADAANDIWVVGQTGTSVFQTFSEHYNGTAWSPVATPDVGTGSNILSGVLALAPNNVWAVGYSTATSKPPPNEYDVPTKTLIEHYNGTSWSIVSSPNVGPNSQYQSNRLLGLTAVSPNDIWAFGSYNAASGNGDEYTLIEHWDGTSWTIATSPTPHNGNPINDILHGGVVTGPGDVWIVGSEDVFSTLVLHTTGG